MSDINQADFFAIQRVVEDWAVFRDAGMFDQLAALFHEDGRMMTTWSQVSGQEFAELTRRGWGNGILVNHAMSGCHIDIAGNRAVAQTKVTIAQRATIDGVVCDAFCDGRFYDLFERRGGAWKIVLRHPIYERDRMTTASPGPAPILDAELLESFPEGYRHLAYLQTKLGLTVKRDMPGLMGPEVEALYAEGREWLAGAGT
ncbi:nuclear transport factor 2 family protein [Sphingomonas bacterium]|uniref:nuclear transport factor 2 family protein n=1 Tax=Sphingomonas bacterium TaxID=1895847 RepID=UPI0015755E42|nr:nuclear transport factor 2 family protein [Sphingomonas bacterium]